MYNQNKKIFYFYFYFVLQIFNTKCFLKNKNNFFFRSNCIKNNIFFSEIMFQKLLSMLFFLEILFQTSSFSKTQSRVHFYSFIQCTKTCFVKSKGKNSSNVFLHFKLYQQHVFFFSAYDLSLFYDSLIMASCFSILLLL